MQKTRWFAPYANSPAGALRPTMTKGTHAVKAGVYFIKRKGSNKIEYVGQSQSQLKKTIYRHFQAWTDKDYYGKSFDRTTYPKTGYLIRFISCTPTQATRLEKYLIDRIQPPGNPIKYKGISDREIKTGEQLLEKYQTAETLNPDVFLVDF